MTAPACLLNRSEAALTMSWGRGCCGQAEIEWLGMTGTAHLVPQTNGEFVKVDKEIDVLL